MEEEFYEVLNSVMGINEDTTPRAVLALILNRINYKTQDLELGENMGVFEPIVKIERNQEFILVSLKFNEKRNENYMKVLNNYEKYFLVKSQDVGDQITTHTLTIMPSKDVQSSLITFYNPIYIATTATKPYQKEVALKILYHESNMNVLKADLNARGSDIEKALEI